MEIIDSIYLLCVPKNFRERGNPGISLPGQKLEIKTKVLDGAHAGSLSKIKERRPPSFSLSLFCHFYFILSFSLDPSLWRLFLSRWTLRLFHQQHHQRQVLPLYPLSKKGC